MNSATSGLAAGTYTGTITVTAPGATGSPKTIGVTLTVTSPVRTISASAGANGAIAPAGSVPVNDGGSQSFTIKPDANYNIKTVLVDGVSVGPVSSYVFNTVTGDCT